MPRTESCGGWAHAFAQKATEATKNSFWTGLDEIREFGILANGSGVAEPSRGVTVGSKKRLPSVRASEGQQ